MNSNNALTHWESHLFHSTFFSALMESLPLLFGSTLHVSPHMIASAEMVARKVGRIDALLFFVIWSCVAAMLASRPIGSLPIIIFLLVPASALVGWRGAASVRLIVSGVASLQRAALEGFTWGAAFAFGIWLWGFSNAALAAGTIFDGLSPLRPVFWVSVATTLLPAMGVAGLLGAMHGVAFLYLNRWLVGANLSINTGAAR
jgi:hypothetical protein